MNQESLSMQNLIYFIKELESLKINTRTAYTSTGKQESIAEHSWRLSILAFLIAEYIPNINSSKLILMCIFHDLGEIYHGDISAKIQVDKMQKQELEKDSIIKATKSLPKSIANKIIDLCDEYNEGKTMESKIAKSIDKIETIIQHNQGKNPKDFDYEFNLDYGKEYIISNDVVKSIRAIVDNETMTNINNNS